MTAISHFVARDRSPSSQVRAMCAPRPARPGWDFILPVGDRDLEPSDGPSPAIFAGALAALLSAFALLIHALNLS